MVEKLIRQTYYLRPDQIKNLRKLSTSLKLDVLERGRGLEAGISELTRDAVDIYLKILKVLVNGIFSKGDD